jgi:hypothetical protein
MIHFEIEVSLWISNCIYFASKYLVEVSELGDLAPQVLHDLLVVSEALSGVLAPAFNDGGAESQALEVVLVQVAIVVNVWKAERKLSPRDKNSRGGRREKFIPSERQNKCLTFARVRRAFYRVAPKKMSKGVQ